jgi:LVIVD repeat
VRSARIRRHLAGRAAARDLEHVHLLTHIPGSAAGMNFKGDYAYVTGWGGVTVLDI